MGNNLPCCEDNDKNTTRKSKSRKSQAAPSVPKSIVPITRTPPEPQSTVKLDTRSFIETKKEQKKSRGPQHYQCVKYLGKGSYGFVVLAEQKITNKRFAMKIIPKSKIRQLNLLQTKLLPDIRRNPFLTNIVEIFQNQENVYIVMQYLPKGDLYFYFKKQDIVFPQASIRDMLSEIIVAVQFLHRQGIVYRELKPQNILLTDEGHLKLTDYGLSKMLAQTDIQKGISTFFGSMEYMAPQIINGTFDQRADLWAMGALMYEMKFKQNLLQNEGQTKYSLKDYKQMLENNFIDEKINSRIGHMSFQFRDILLRLLEKEPRERISIQDLKKHPFFEETNWQAVENRQNEGPFAELIKKGDYIKFRDPTTQQKNRFDVLQKHSKNVFFALQLCQFRNSQ